MKRPWIAWLVYGLAVVAVLGATAWISVLAVGLDRRDAESQQRAIHEENIRLALWRMDTTVMALLAREEARPPFHYSAFYPAQDAYSNVLQSYKYGDVLVPSPLLTQDSPFVQVHFQIDSAGRLSSPQVPSDQLNMKSLAQTRYQATQRIERSDRALQTLGRTLGIPPLLRTARTLEAPERLTTAWVDNTQPATRVVRAASRGDYAQRAARNSAVQQAEVSDNELQKRQQASQSFLNLSKLSSRVLPNSSSIGSSSPIKQPAAKTVEDASARRSAQVKEGRLEPRWLDGQLLLMRRVSIDGDELVQGCWLDWPALQQQLKSEIEDLLPDASLKPLAATAAPAHGNRRLASAPIHLAPAAFAPVAEPLSATVRNALGVAWIGVILAVLAVGVLIRMALALSERRGAFVSAVTHELRTPLTTFRMYTQMLAEDMVPDEQARKDYVNTLRVESDRLGHLVENVLAYARLEKVGTETRAENIRLGELLDRTEQRLRQRADQAGVPWSIEAAEAARRIPLRTDVSAVEQILFNLVDNACKYGQNGENLGVTLAVETAEGRVRLKVRDHGAGVGQDVRTRLFQPFSKSATVAAHSAPGVGLGLALSRRLARGVGGELKIETVDDGPGACFVLTLPVTHPANA